MQTDEQKRKFILSLSTSFIIFITTLIFHQTQSIYKLYTQGARYFNAHKYSEALPFFISAFKMEPNNMQAAMFLLRNYEKLGMKRAAKPVLEELIKQNPQQLDFIEFLADISSWTKEYNNAIELYKKLLSRGYHRHGILLKLADNLRYASRDEEAIKLYDQYLKENQ